MRAWVPLSLLAASILATACNEQTSPRPPAASPVSTVPAAISASPVGLLADLNALPVIVEVPGYRRELFGQPWRDTDHTGCDQRTDAMARDAQTITRDARRHCRIVAILMTDPYTGKPLTSTADIQIDHVVPLAAAWRAGAYAWTDDQRERFATDLDNLLPTQGRVNLVKSDQTPDTWRPPDATAYCHYVTIYVTICKRYALGVTQPVHDALAELATSCR